MALEPGKKYTVLNFIRGLLDPGTQPEGGLVPVSGILTEGTVFLTPKQLLDELATPQTVMHYIRSNTPLPYEANIEIIPFIGNLMSRYPNFDNYRTELRLKDWAAFIAKQPELNLPLPKFEMMEMFEVIKQLSILLINGLYGNYDQYVKDYRENQRKGTIENWKQIAIGLTAGVAAALIVPAAIAAIPVETAIAALAEGGKKIYGYITDIDNIVDAGNEILKDTAEGLLDEGRRKAVDAIEELDNSIFLDLSSLSEDVNEGLSNISNKITEGLGEVIVDIVEVFTKQVNGIDKALSEPESKERQALNETNLNIGLGFGASLKALLFKPKVTA